MFKKNLLTNSSFYSKLIHVVFKVMHIYIGVWLSLVEHYFREVGAASSNLVTPIIPLEHGLLKSSCFFVMAVKINHLLCATS